MTEHSNLDAFFEAQFQVASTLFGDGDLEYQGTCLRLLENPALPMHRRVTCNFMMAQSPSSDDSEFYIEKAFETLQKIDRLIENGICGESLKPWTVRARRNLEALQSMLESTQTDSDDEDEIEEKEVESDVEVGEHTVADEKEGGDPKLEQYAVAEEEKADFEMEKRAVADEEDGKEKEDPDVVAPATARGQDMVVICRHSPSSGTTPPSERGAELAGHNTSSPPVHPIVRQMEDEAEKPSGSAHESMTNEEEVAWYESAMERARQRILERSKTEDDGAGKEDRDDADKDDENEGGDGKDQLVSKE